MSRRFLCISCSLCLLLFCAPALLFGDTVHIYTNVTMNNGHFLVAEGTAGADVIASQGSIGLGRGGCGTTLYDDCYIAPASSPLGNNADYFDRYWSQIYFGQNGYLTFDLGQAYSRAYIALNQDHGPYPQEALEYRVWVSNDNTTFTELPSTTPITMFKGGWSAAGEFGGDANGNGVLNDDYSALWNLGGGYRYLRLTALQAGGGYDEPEIDAVMGVSAPEPNTILCLGFMLAALGISRLSRR